MKAKHILGVILFYFFQFLYPQPASRPVQADINWNGRMCNGGHGICYVKKKRKTYYARPCLLR